MHKEVIAERKMPAFIISILVVTMALYLNSFVEVTRIGNVITRKAITVTSILIVMVILVREINRCRTCYKYSIISDKLIINRISIRKNKNLETVSINIKEILYIGDKDRLPKEYCRCKCGKYHTRELGNNEKFCCVYLKNGKISSFVFRPSKKMVDRMKTKVSVQI